MKSSWTDGLDESKEKDVRGNYETSLVTRRRLTELLESKIKTSQVVSRAKSAYDTPNWSYLQADAIGYERAMAEVMDLIK